VETEFAYSVQIFIIAMAEFSIDFRKRRYFQI